MQVSVHYAVPARVLFEALTEERYTARKGLYEVYEGTSGVSEDWGVYAVWGGRAWISSRTGEGQVGSTWADTAVMGDEGVA